MIRSSTWEHVLAAPPPGRHIVQLYTDAAFLARGVARFVGGGLRVGQGAVVVATPEHWTFIARRLADDGLDVVALERARRLVVVDAVEALGTILVEGSPDRARFRALLDPAVEAADAAGRGGVRAFGELVDLLRRKSVAATLRLESLWAELLLVHPMTVLCAYCLDAFDPAIYRGLLQSLSAAHSDLVPVEDYARLERAVEWAYADVFGADGAPASLRRTFLAHYDRPAAMPDAAAAILAARHYVPSTAAALLARVRHHYGASEPLSANGQVRRAG